MSTLQRQISPVLSKHIAVEQIFLQTNKLTNFLCFAESVTVGFIDKMKCRAVSYQIISNSHTSSGHDNMAKSLLKNPKQLLLLQKAKTFPFKNQLLSLTNQSSET